MSKATVHQLAISVAASVIGYVLLRKFVDPVFFNSQGN
jgi:hypothetical protein